MSKKQHPLAGMIGAPSENGAKLAQKQKGASGHPFSGWRGGPSLAEHGIEQRAKSTAPGGHPLAGFAGAPAVDRPAQAMTEEAIVAKLRSWAGLPGVSPSTKGMPGMGGGLDAQIETILGILKPGTEEERQGLIAALREMLADGPAVAIKSKSVAGSLTLVTK